MLYPSERRIWYQGVRFDLIDTSGTPYVIPSVTGNDAFYRMTFMPTACNVIIIDHDTILDMHDMRSIWISPNANTICVSRDGEMSRPMNYTPGNCLIDISNKFVVIHDSPWGFTVRLIPIPDMKELNSDVEIKYPLSWALSFRDSNIYAQASNDPCSLFNNGYSPKKDELLPIRTMTYVHENPLLPPHTSSLGTT